MNKAKKPKDLTKLKRAQEQEQRDRQAVRMVFNAAGIGDDYSESEPMHLALEGKLVPRVRMLADLAAKAAKSGHQ